MQTVWLADLPPKEAQQFKQTVLGSVKVLDKASQIVYNMIKSQERVSVTDYESPSWAYRQADRNGYIRALEQVIKLLNVNPDPEK